MTDAITALAVFFGLSMPIVLPLLVLIGLPLTAWLARSYLRIREREVELRGLEVALRLRESRMLPAWVDENDPKSLLAWARTDAEMAGLFGQPAAERTALERR